MSGDDVSGRPPQLLLLLQQSQSFAEGLLRENEDMRRRQRALEARCQAAEKERDDLRAQLGQPTTERSIDGEAFRGLEAELNNLANLHVATWQLHSSLDLPTVATVVVEICLNLVGASAVELYLHDESAGRLLRIHQYGNREAGEHIDLHHGDPHEAGPISRAATTRQPLVREGDEPLGVIPLVLSERLVGVLVIHALLPHKEGLAPLDHEFFDLLGRQAANALLSAYLATTQDTQLTEEPIRQALRSHSQRNGRGG